MVYNAQSIHVLEGLDQLEKDQVCILEILDKEVCII